MKWLSNTTDHRGGKNRDSLLCMYGETSAEAQRRWDGWTHDKVFGPPQATEACSQAQLEKWGLVGVYVRE